MTLNVIPQTPETTSCCMRPRSLGSVQLVECTAFGAFDIVVYEVGWKCPAHEWYGCVNVGNGDPTRFLLDSVTRSWRCEVGDP